MQTVQDFITSQQGIQRDVLLYLDAMITSYPGVTSKIRYKIPFYYPKSWICYLNPIKHDGIELAFLRGNELSNEQGILQAHGRKQVKGLRFYALEEIPEEAVREILQEALILDVTVTYGRRTKDKT